MKRRYALLLVTVSLLLGYTSVGFAQNPTITGTVSDAQTGQVLPGVNIIVSYYDTYFSIKIPLNGHGE